MVEKRKNQFEKIMGIGLLALLIVQFLVLVYFNLKLNAQHVDYDSSWVYLKAALVWKEKTFISSNWSDTTNPFFDLSLPLASLLYGITGRLFFSYGISTLTVLLGIIASVFFILKRFNVNKIGILTVLNLILCPFLTNGFDPVIELGFFNCVLVGPSHYGLRTLIVLLIILEYLNIQQRKKIDFVFFLSIALCFVSGMSSGVYLIAMIILPILAFLFECMFIKNEFKVFVKKESIYTYICLVFVILGKLFASRILNIQIRDSGNKWTSVVDFWTNIGAPIQGLFKLLEIFPVAETDVSVLSARGIAVVFPLFILFVIFLAFIFASVSIYQKIKEKTGTVPEVLFLINDVFVHFVMFGFMNVQYGLAVFEERYLIPAFFVLVILVGIFIRNIKMDLLVSRFILIGLFISIFAINIISDINYAGYSNNYDYMMHIKDIAQRENVGLVYFYGEDSADNMLDVLMCRNLRAIDVDRVYKYASTKGYFKHWGDYLYYEDNSGYEGDILLIVYSDKKEIIKDYIFEQLELIEEDDVFAIYKGKKNPIDCVVGINGDINVDYPTTPGMITTNSEVQQTSIISDGTRGFVMYGPYTDTPDGTYDFILEYSLLDGDDAYFDVVTDSVNEKGIVYLTPDENQAVIENVNLSSGHILEYRVFCGEGTKIQIDKITIIKEE